MGPKKKPASKQQKIPIVPINGIVTNEITKEQLEVHLQQLREELDRQQQERNYFQIERDKIYQFWEITKNELEAKRAELRNKEHEIEEILEKHQVEIKIYKQKVKHLLFEHQNNLSELKGESATKLKLIEDEHRLSEKEVFKEIKNLKACLKEQEVLHEDNIKIFKMKQEEFLSKQRIDFKNQTKEIQLKHDRNLQNLREELHLIRKNEIHEIEDRKSEQINALTKNHEKAFAEIKNYYNDIILNNMALINTLKEEIEQLHHKENYTQKSLQEATTENKKFSVNLQKSEKEKEDLHKKLQSYEKDKMFLKNCKGKVKELSEEIDSLQWEHKLLEQKFEKVEMERDEIYRKFVSAIHEVHQKSNLKNMLLEKKLAEMSKILEKKEAQLSQVMETANLDPSVVNLISRKIEDMMDTKNNAIQDMQYELGQVCKAHNDIMRTYEAKLKEYHVPVTELGFEPLQVVVAGQQLSKGPAGLVSKQISRF